MNYKEAVSTACMQHPLIGRWNLGKHLTDDFEVFTVFVEDFRDLASSTLELATSRCQLLVPPLQYFTTCSKKIVIIHGSVASERGNILGSPLIRSAPTKLMTFLVIKT